MTPTSLSQNHPTGTTSTTASVDLTRAEKLKLWQSRKSSSSSISTSSTLSSTPSSSHSSNPSNTPPPLPPPPTTTPKLMSYRQNKDDIGRGVQQQQQQVGGPGVGNKYRKQFLSNGNQKSILFKKKNIKKYQNNFYHQKLFQPSPHPHPHPLPQPLDLTLPLPQSQSQAHPQSESSQDSKILLILDEDARSNEENSCPNDSSQKLITPVTKKKILTQLTQPSPSLDLDGYLTANDESLSHTSPPPSPPSPAFSSSSSFLTKTLEKLQNENLKLKRQLQQSTQIQNEAVAIAQMSQQEIECLNFANDILFQRSNQIEEQLTRERMRYHEKDNHRVDKYKEEIKNLKAKNSEYERRANEMVSEMNQQMSQLQDMAMSRIESLEKELLLEQHKSETLQNSIQKLSLQNNTKEKYVRRRTNTLISATSSSIISPLPVRSRGSRRSKLSTETEESSGDEDDSLTVGSNSDDENDQLMALTLPQDAPKGDEEESRYDKYN